MKPPAVVVNEKDEVIGHKHRDDINPASDIYRVSALWLTNPNEEVLIAQRKLTKKQAPGKWGPAVAGTVEEGESYESNIYKEAEEEIGLTGLSFALGPKQRVSNNRNYFVQWYIAKIDRPVDEFTIEEDEVEQVAWIPKDQLLKEIKETPEKYVSPMPGAVELIYG